ncbi:NAD(P)H-hydrate dehydratase [uncultured Tateyamaria sp.]|uniref:NAD(P)H-hydrate dehydratase n=1 Tax=uncultured Tateyamaria sp. TaxID=455651 RepID=UPI00260E298D|nr:NAD(P)H-hydrate dehydratase [uncultured Tateyamaria sp.]
MTELLTAAQMRAIEQAAIESGQVTGLELMERAGAGVVEAVLEEWPELAEGPHRAVVLCGPGNNGGDGFVVARLLADAGWSVEVFSYGDANKLPPDARTNYERWCEVGEVATLTLEALMARARPDLLIDAVFGIGLNRPVPDDLAACLAKACHGGWKKSYAVRRVAIDCPSGLDADTGVFHSGKYVWSSHLTVTFHTPKLGHYLAMGPTLCKKLNVVDIGLRGDAMERGIVGLPPEPERARLVEGRHFGAAGLTPLEARFWPVGAMGKHRKGVGAHKYDFGHVIVFAGGVGRGGAARMAARAALRVGAGLVTVVCPKAAVLENAMQLNAIMLRGLVDGDALDTVADDRVGAFCLGPGMGVGAAARARVLEVLARRKTERDWRDPAVVLDADALTSFEGDTEPLFAALHPRTVLTPHEGEFARLFPDLAMSERGTLSKVEAVRTAAARAGCIVLLKGSDTVIAAPNGGASVHSAEYDREVPWLATAGAGDVLAGLIAGLAAPDLSSDIFSMVEVAAWLHVECARAFGPGLIAEDLPEMLPQVLRELEA